MSDVENREPAPEANHHTEESWAALGRGYAIIFLILFTILAIGFGPMLLDERRNARILKEGVPSKARVTKIVPTGNYHNEQPEVLISLEVTPDAGEPFDSKVETYMSPVYLPRFQPGFTVDVRFDPKKHKDVALVEP